MNDYAAYGLTIRSDFPLPELVEASALESASTSRPQGGPDVFISLASYSDRPVAPHPSSSNTWATADSALIDYPGTAAFFVRDGREVAIHLAPDADPRLVRLYLLGPILALLLHQRQFLVLHASAIVLRGAVVAFVGEKGMGKSTMAAALHARGHALVADDLVPVDTRGATPLAYPGFPQLKLFPASAALLDAAPELLPKVHPDLDKRARRTTSRFPTSALPLSRIFVLTDNDIEAIEPLTPRQAFMELVRHSYLLTFLRATGSAELHFRQATALASAVSVARLHRRRSFDVLPSVAELVEGAIERAA